MRKSIARLRSALLTGSRILSIPCWRGFFPYIPIAQWLYTRIDVVDGFLRTSYKAGGLGFEIVKGSCIYAEDVVKYIRNRQGNCRMDDVGTDKEAKESGKAHRGRSVVLWVIDTTDF